MEIAPGFRHASGLREYGVLFCLIIQIPQSTDWLLNVGQQVRKPVLDFV